MNKPKLETTNAFFIKKDSIKKNKKTNNGLPYFGYEKIKFNEFLTDDNEYRSNLDLSDRPSINSYNYENLSLAERNYQRIKEEDTSAFIAINDWFDRTQKLILSENERLHEKIINLDQRGDMNDKKKWFFKTKKLKVSESPITDSEDEKNYNIYQKDILFEHAREVVEKNSRNLIKDNTKVLNLDDLNIYEEDIIDSKTNDNVSFEEDNDIFLTNAFVSENNQENKTQNESYTKILRNSSPLLEPKQDLRIRRSDKREIKKRVG